LAPAGNPGKPDVERVALVAKMAQLRSQSAQLADWIGWAKDIDDPGTQRMLAWAEERLRENERALNPASFGA